jgi:hypothetical protein
MKRKPKALKVKSERNLFGGSRGKMPPPGFRHKDAKKEADKRAARGRVTDED